MYIIRLQLKDSSWVDCCLKIGESFLNMMLWNKFASETGVSKLQTKNIGESLSSIRKNFGIERK